ncbi:OLC1v1012505C1 [Oldenlandia corymbosa var. corymbosa]|uniref:OLC1v1012505C1 n=1 Tax=Oldenlandia corymbosa var. corymbosa TaxID=529605 RepID=A0AAV1DWB0_OLDCO|nr:OLC1v1012505C1 [Oldenlandia corymbosa var. corymbosa]
MPPKPTSGRNQQVEEPEAASSNPAMDDIQRTLNQLVGSMRELFDANREIREEMHTLKEEVQIDESDDAMEARFIRGLNRNIRDQVENEAMKCNSLEEVVAFADLIEKHLKEKESRSRFTPGGSTSKPTPPKKLMPSSSTSQPKIVVKPTVNNLPKKVITPPQGQERRV